MTDVTTPDGSGQAGDAPGTYEYLWTCHPFDEETTRLDEMITYLQRATELLRQMQAAGVVLKETFVKEDGSGYAVLVTNDPPVAERLGFEPVNEAEFDAEGDEIDEGSCGGNVPSFDRYALKPIVIPGFI